MFTPQEVVELTLSFYRRNYIEGLFLSSGIVRSANHTFELLLQVARLLREEHGYGGYLHLKVPLGIDEEMLSEGARLADRLSCNVEMPDEKALEKLAPGKQMKDVHRAMGALKGEVDSAKASRRSSRVGSGPSKKLGAARDNEGHSIAVLPAGQSTQMVVGASDSSDEQVLRTSSSLYQDYRLRRVYYSGYSPIPDASSWLPTKPAPLLREHRLYQADWLLRFYGFDVEELFEAGQPQLDLELDPKTAYALRHRELFPVDINRADREALLRVPGFGQRAVERVVQARRRRRLRLEDLKKMNIRLKKAEPFIVAAGRERVLGFGLDRADLRSILIGGPRQLSFAELSSETRSGQL